MQGAFTLEKCRSFPAAGLLQLVVDVNESLRPTGQTEAGLAWRLWVSRKAYPGRLMKASRLNPPISIRNCRADVADCSRRSVKRAAV